MIHAARTDEKITDKKDFLAIADFSADEIKDFLELAKKIKAKRVMGEPYTPLAGKTLGMIFEKPSTRTRVSFEAGMLQLGGHALFLSSQDLQIGRGETIADTARVLSRYLDGIMIRTFNHETLEVLAKNAEIPVINGLTDLNHPCQALADLLTIHEIKGELEGLKMAYIGDGNNMAHSLMAACAKMGIHFSLACPKGYKPNEELVLSAAKEAAKNGTELVVTDDPVSAVKDADIIYSDVWTSMGQEEENEIRLKHFKDFQINQDLTQHAKKDYIFMHCLPAHRGEEATAEVIDGEHSVIFHQAENRLHAQKAILVDLLK
ncbi:ornithine carbamoyltransferase [Peribacillus kribbensis]|uniref:ornithine carbamoyltransferase n=1 Tax=Peribacillus kribbensis TaxID=356658 RepID=UPI0005514A7B|nr:ornithine carbamoyltransferase [Peribacillus kribbensis]